MASVVFREGSGDPFGGGGEHVRGDPVIAHRLVVRRDRVEPVRREVPLSCEGAGMERGEPERCRGARARVFRSDGGKPAQALGRAPTGGRGAEFDDPAAAEGAGEVVVPDHQAVADLDVQRVEAATSVSTRAAPGRGVSSMSSSRPWAWLAAW